MKPVQPHPTQTSRWGVGVLAILAVGLCGCGGGNTNSDTLTVGFVYIGPRDDYGYNQAHAQGAAAVKKMEGVRIVEMEQVPDTVDVQKALTAMIEDENARVVFATSFNYYDPHTLKLARQYPEVTFLHCGGLWDAKAHPANVSTYFGYIDECEYLSGIVAAHATKSKKVGFVAGKPIPQVRRNINAFALGARSVDPSIRCLVVFTGDWSLTVKEAEAANSLIDQGVDVLTCHVNSPKVVIETAERHGIFTCGYHCSQADLAPRGYLTGAEWSWEKVYTDYVAALRAGRKVPNQLRGGLKDGIVKMSPYGAAVGEEGKRAAETVKARFLDGSFVIFKGPLTDNTGKVVIPQGVSYAQTDAELERMEYLVEGVVGK